MAAIGAWRCGALVNASAVEPEALRLGLVVSLTSSLWLIKGFSGR